MSKKSGLALLVVVLMAMCLPAVSIYAWQKMQLTPDDEASKIASDYLRARNKCLIHCTSPDIRVSERLDR